MATYLLILAAAGFGMGLTAPSQNSTVQLQKPSAPLNISVQITSSQSK